MISLASLATLYNNSFAADFTVTDGTSSVYLHRTILNCNPFFSTYFSTKVGTDQTKLVLSKELFLLAQPLLRMIYDTQFFLTNENGLNYMEMLRLADQWFLPNSRKGEIVFRIKANLASYTYDLKGLLEVARQYTWVDDLVTFVIDHLDEFDEDIMESGIQNCFSVAQFIQACIHFKNVKWITPERDLPLNLIYARIAEIPDPTFCGIGDQHFMLWEAAEIIKWREEPTDYIVDGDVLIIDSLVPYRAEYRSQCHTEIPTTTAQGIRLILNQTVSIGDTVNVDDQHYTIRKMYYTCKDRVTQITMGYRNIECIIDIGTTEIDDTTIISLVRMQN